MAILMIFLCRWLARPRDCCRKGAERGDSKERVLVLVLMLEGMRAWVETAAVARRKKRLPSHDEAMMMVVMQASLCFLVGKEGVGGQQTEAMHTLLTC